MNCSFFFRHLLLPSPLRKVVDPDSEASGSGPLAVDEVKRKDLCSRLAFTLPLPH